jgi:hypothetical protein
VATAYDLAGARSNFVELSLVDELLASLGRRMICRAPAAENPAQEPD